MIGETIGSYRIIAKLGEGGMGEVYRAHDDRLGRDVAIKFSREQFSERFEREARAIAALNHPNICHLYDVGPNYLVMELIEGETLKGPLPLEQALNFATQIAGALEAAHERGIVHRDLKPANIKVTPDGTVKVLDFGLAKNAGTPPGDPQSSPTMTMSPTRAGMILGTAAYMAPEQARGKTVDKRADIWAFGCVVFEMLTGRQAFHGETTSDLLAAVIKEQPDLSDVPAHLRPAIEKCLRKDPRTRWRDIGDARSALEEAKPEPSVEPRKHSIWPWAVAAVFALAFATIAVVHFTAKPLPAQVVRFQVLPPEGNSFGIAFALSPDGKHIVFPARGGDGRSRLWVRSLDSFEARPLPGTEGATYLPWWSPDSRYIAFGNGGKLRKLDIAGGPPVALCDAPQIITGGSWSSKGVILFHSTTNGLSKVPDSGGPAVLVTALAQGEYQHYSSMFLPDGTHFIYTRQPFDLTAAAVYIGSIDAKPEEQSRKPLLNAAYAMYAGMPGDSRGHLLFLRETTLMAQPFDPAKLETTGEAVPIAENVGFYIVRGLFSVSQTGVLAYSAGVGGRSRIAWYDRQGKLLNYVTDIGVNDTLALSPDATRLVYRRAETVNRNLWIADLVRGGSTRFTFTPSSSDQNPVWSPDGRRVVFVSTRGSNDLYIKDAGGASAEEPLLKSPELKYPLSWSRDGKFLLYTVQHQKTGFDLWTLSMEGERKTAPFLQTEFREAEGEFSPDGHWVAYSSDVSGVQEVYVRPFPPSENGAQFQISNGGGSQPRWRGDGKELYFLSGGRKVMAVEVSASPAFHAGVPTVLAEVPIVAGSTPVSRDWDVTADGKKFLISGSATGFASPPISVVLNWQAGLKK